jgi:hypothetical protein
MITAGQEVKIKPEFHIASESDFDGDQVWDLLDDAKSLVEEQIEDIESEMSDEEEDEEPIAEGDHHRYRPPGQIGSDE